MGQGLGDLARVLSGLQPLTRTRWKGWGWLAGTAALAGGGGWFHSQAASDQRAYDREREDISRLLDHKQSALQNYWIAAGFYTVALAAGGITLWQFLREDRTFDVQETGQAGAPPKASLRVIPHPSGVALALRF